MALQQRMRAPQVGRVDAPEVLAQRGLQHAGVDQLGHPVQQVVLALHVRGLVQRAGEHRFPVQRQRLALECHHIDLAGIIDQPQLALRRQQLDDLRVVLIGVGQAGHVMYLADAQPRQALGQRQAVVDYMVRPHRIHPVLGIRARGGADHRQLGQLPRQLHQDRSDATGSADHQQGLAFAAALGDAQAVEQQFPGGDRGQRQRRGGGIVETGRLAADAALVHQLVLRIAAGAVDHAGVVDRIARLEQGHLAAHRVDDADRIPTEHARAIGGHAAAHLGHAGRAAAAPVRYRSGPGHH
ncbi:hypothetical protein G6F22_014185 [Rhizopus arrhizus]|nr:hypothetical protein G6F22_014185 [Rhizopus arrhizus]